MTEKVMVYELKDKDGNLVTYVAVPFIDGAMKIETQVALGTDPAVIGSDVVWLLTEEPPA